MLTLLNEQDCEQVLATVATGMLIAFKKQCPHCKNMEKVLEKCQDKIASLALYGIDSEENPALCTKLGIERTPTIFILHQGHIVEKVTGLMNPRELTSVYQQAIRS